MDLAITAALRDTPFMTQTLATITGPSTGWQRGGEQSSRSCAVSVNLLDACADGTVELLPGGAPAIYETAPFLVQSILAQPTRCSAPDDTAWLKGLMPDLLALAAARSLITPPDPDSFAANRIWLGSPGVQDVPATDDPAADIAAARTQWLMSVVGQGAPTLHISPSSVPALLAARVIQNTATGNLRTAWNDAVQTSPAYDPGPVAFWAGKIAVTASTVDALTTADAKHNQAVTTADAVVLVDIPPCAIVRVGAAPTA